MLSSLGNVQQLQPEVDACMTADVLAMVFSTTQPGSDLVVDPCPEQMETTSQTKVLKDKGAKVLKDIGFEDPGCSTSTSATCTAGETDADYNETDADYNELLLSFYSFYDTTRPGSQDPAHPPNQVLHEWHSERVRRFLKGVSQHPRLFQSQVEASRQAPRQIPSRARIVSRLASLRNKYLSHSICCAGYV
mmetsp:Transcript_68355/g.160841  ORF Transcript_68355/g.160841 Transcript_68355/m.160841 type:complete len:191 (+) Transcript_68355:63-635(+)